jgi:hypothetical protein
MLKNYEIVNGKKGKNGIDGAMKLTWHLWNSNGAVENAMPVLLVQVVVVSALHHVIHVQVIEKKMNSLLAIQARTMVVVVKRM